MTSPWASRCRAIVARATELYERIDVLATAASPVGAPPIELDQVQVGDRLEPVRSAMGRLCRLGSFSGFPAIVVPSGFTSTGLPSSLHLMTAPYREGLALRAAQAYEQATDWHTRRPLE